MQGQYIDIIILLHAAFAGVFLFLNLQSAARFTRLFAVCWMIEGIRAAILVPEVRQLGGSQEYWFCASDILCFVANACLVIACAELVRVRLPRWLTPAYLCSGVPIVILNRFWLPGFLAAHMGLAETDARFFCVLANLTIMFVPVGISRMVATVWLFRVWRKDRLPGALVAAFFCVPYALVAFGVPFEFYYSYSPDWIALVWCVRVLGFSVGLVILMLDYQRTALARSAANLATAQAIAHIGSCELTVATGEAIWSDEMFRLYGIEPERGVPSRAQLLECVHPEDRRLYQKHLDDTLSGLKPRAIEFRILRPDATLRWIERHNTQSISGTGEVVKIFAVERDITTQKESDLRRQLQHSVTEVLAQGAALPVTIRQILEILARGLSANICAYWTADKGMRTLRCMEIWQRPETDTDDFVAASRQLTFSHGQGLAGSVLASRESRFMTELDLLAERFQRRDVAKTAGIRTGAAFPIMLRGEIFGVIEFFTAEPRLSDPFFTPLFSAIGTQIGQFIERQRLEEQYRHSQKMEAVGTLAGGIAHDFNNILTAISGYCELARLELSADSGIHTHLQAVQQGAHRATELVRQIMAFSRRQEQSRRTLRIESIVQEAIHLLRATIPATIELQTKFDDQAPCVFADATSVHQVLVNLGTNASYAMKGRSGAIEIQVEGVDVCADFAEAHAGLRVGRYARLTVADTGHGMSASTLSRIFEPFFTTKPPGEGTGLGLSVVHGIVQAHDGAMFVYSQPEKGTKFDLYFPAHVAAVAETVPGAVAAAPQGRGERVLYVEDEGPLGHMGRKILERMNYVVDVHSSPLAALQAFETKPDDYQLIVTDLTMPAMTGIELAKQVLEVRPGIPIILMTGYAGTFDAAQARTAGFTELLLKPLSLDVLANAVSRALNASAVRV